MTEDQAWALELLGNKAHGYVGVDAFFRMAAATIDHEVNGDFVDTPMDVLQEIGKELGIDQIANMSERK